MHSHYSTLRRVTMAASRAHPPYRNGRLLPFLTKVRLSEQSRRAIHTPR
jgi:hypothetical protein